MAALKHDFSFRMNPWAVNSWRLYCRPYRAPDSRQLIIPEFITEKHIFFIVKVWLVSSQEGNQEMTIVQIHTTLTFFFTLFFLALLWLFLFYHHQTDETEKNVEDKYECGGEGEQVDNHGID